MRLNQKGGVITIKAKTATISPSTKQKSPRKQTENQLLKEYSINADFWKHHDTMRQTKMGNFLTVNSILAAAIALLTSGIFADIKTLLIVSIIGISVMGFFISVTWYFVMLRNSEYMRFQRLQLVSIEKKNQGVFSTFTRMYDVFDKNIPVNLPYCNVEFPCKTQSASKLEEALPLVVAVSWVVVVISFIAFLIRG